MSLSFFEHTKEKLDVIKNYYEKWALIVSSQKCYIIECNAGMGYVKINGMDQKILGSSLIAIDLFNEIDKEKLKLFLIEKDKEIFNNLKNNILEYIKKRDLSINFGTEIELYNSDWADVIENIISQTQDGIKLFFLDPFAIQSLPWKKLLVLIEKGRSLFGYKETGIEILINWAWHTVRRKIGRYFAYKMDNSKSKGLEGELKILKKYFGPFDWKKIVDKYPLNLFQIKTKESRNQIEKLIEELVISYALNVSNYFKYVKIHSVYTRKKNRKTNILERGSLKYFLIFASNYQGSLDIIDETFKIYRDKRIFANDQETLTKFFNESNPSTDNLIPFKDRIKSLEKDIGEIYSINKKIIKFLYYRKNYDYGCYEFALFKKFKIDNDHYSINFLLKNEIISVRKRMAKTGHVGNYYYIVHPKLIDRNEYLFLDDKTYLIEKGKLIEF